jgi:hypothetical protein
MDYVFCALIVGVGATAVMDLWGIVRKALIGVPPANYGLVGRWIAGVARGRFRNDSIATSPAVRFEGLIGWSAHYLIGIAFAAVLLSICGLEWIEEPTIIPALIVGIGTVAAPFLLMQPGMGAGIAASRTPNPAAARLQSLITHAVFGLGLYGAAFVARLIYMQGLLTL